jgi:hypothetical protein
VITVDVLPCKSLVRQNVFGNQLVEQIVVGENFPRKFYKHTLVLMFKFMNMFLNFNLSTFSCCILLPYIGTDCVVVPHGDFCTG